jgi:hypothetical protein
MMKQLAAIGAIGVFSTCLFAQGLNTSQTKDQWEEINFEFNSSILSDGYPSLLRLAEMLSQHRDYNVKLTGNTDYVGSARYNDRLAMRAPRPSRFPGEVRRRCRIRLTTAGDGKKAARGRQQDQGRPLHEPPRGDDGHRRPRQMVAAGGISEVSCLASWRTCSRSRRNAARNILKRLDKLDDILAAVRDLKGENDRLKGQLAELGKAQKALEDKVNGIAEAADQGRDHRDRRKGRHRRGRRGAGAQQEILAAGTGYGPHDYGNRPRRRDVHGSGQFFSPFGGDGTHAVQAQGEYIVLPGDQEGQFDIGLVNRWDHLQAGLFSSFKYIRLWRTTSGGSMGQGDFLLDYLFSRGRIGFYGTEGFKNTGALLLTPLGPSSFTETYARPMDQFGLSTQVGVWGDAWIQGNLGYIHSRGSCGTPGQSCGKPGRRNQAGAAYRQGTGLHRARRPESHVNHSEEYRRVDRGIGIRQFHAAEGVHHFHASGADGRPAYPL